MRNVPRDQWTAEHLRFWRVDGRWHCAVPRDDISTQNGLCWRKYGLIGRGTTKQKAIEDWECWMRASKIASDIY